MKGRPLVAARSPAKLLPDLGYLFPTFLVNPLNPLSAVYSVAFFIPPLLTVTGPVFRHDGRFHGILWRPDSPDM